jgi:hypothetical protein
MGHAALPFANGCFGSFRDQTGATGERFTGRANFVEGHGSLPSVFLIGAGPRRPQLALRHRGTVRNGLAA